MFSTTLVERATQHDMGKRAIPLLHVWIYFNLIGNTIFLPLLVGTFLFSKRVKRHPTLINVCMTWILSGIFSLLLFYAHRAMPWDPEPSRALCIAQTSLLYGITPMWSVAVVVLLYYIVGVITGNGTNIGKGRMIFMLAAPYFVLISFTIATLAISVSHPKEVTREHRFFYCALKFFPLSNAMAVFTFIVCLGIILLEVQLATSMYRNWRGLRRAGHHTGIELQILLRVLVFGAYIFFGMVVNVISIFDEHSLAPDMYAATVGTAVFLVFGTQPDVFRVWCFWGKPSPPPQIPPVYLTREPTWGRNLDLLKSASPEKSGQAFADLIGSAPVSPPRAAQIADHVHALHNQAQYQRV